MGNIYLEIKSSKINMSNIDLVDFSNVGNYDVEYLFKKQELRDYLIKKPMSTKLQSMLIGLVDFTEDELDIIFEINKNNLRDAWSHYYTTFSIDFINKHAEHMNLQVIHLQKNLDAAFIEKYMHSIHLPSVVSTMIEQNGIESIIPLLHIENIIDLVLPTLSWNISKTELTNILQHIPQHADTINEKIDNAFNTEISVANLEYMYDTFGGQYSSNAIINYYNSNYDNNTVRTYEDWVEEATRTGEYTLPKIIWKDHIIRKLLK